MADGFGVLNVLSSSDKTLTSYCRSSNHFNAAMVMNGVLVWISKPFMRADDSLEVGTTRRLRQSLKSNPRLVSVET